jgi:hypothetical protein
MSVKSAYKTSYSNMRGLAQNTKVLSTLSKGLLRQSEQGANMKHDHDEDLFGDLILTAVAIFLFVLLVAGIGSFVWWLIT